MNTFYITLFNGLTLMVKPTEILGKYLYCYHWFNNSWIPISLNIDSISDIRNLTILENTLPNYNVYSIKSMYRTDSGGTELLLNTSGGFKTTQLLKQGANANFQSGTVIAPVFPKIDPNWFYTGFPTKVPVGNAKGNLIDYIPIFFYATRDGNEKFTLPTIPGRIGFLDKNNEFKDTIIWNGPFKKGDLLFTLLLDKNDPSANGSKILNNSYWNLLTEFSNIDPGSSATKSITITSGITKTESTSLGLSIGSRIGLEIGLESIGKISAELSTQLSTSFNTSVSITQQITTTDTVEFKPQPRTQRIATYQFIEQYEIDAAQPLKDKISFFNDATKNYIANFTKAEFNPTSFDYSSRYFAKAFVLEP
ncbi:hypothetical protein Z965_00065 [Clostridium novyi A str. BKT29909]|uniref:hypothetical protein n=1 Tax=Clostridium novyi TaxID=1542 RepID=UPI0004D845D9|nr:hypothetical protein [Clostridium novyi]KEH91295.1 hypothetical protein Z965_00065 [Clostridium novyi A str. BKT29909]